MTNDLNVDKARSYAVVPAAGRSRRMGRHKLLLPWQSGRIIDAVLRAWRSSAVSQVVVVTRADDHELHRRCHDVDLVVADPAPNEMSDSVRIALKHIHNGYRPTPSDCWLLAPADQVFLSPRVVNLLLDAHNASSPQILIPEHAGQRGHPVLFPWTLASRVADLPREGTIRDLVHDVGYRSLPMEEPGVLFDLDTPEDYRRARSLPPVSTDEDAE